MKEEKVCSVQDLKVAEIKKMMNQVKVNERRIDLIIENNGADLCEKQDKS